MSIFKEMYPYRQFHSWQDFNEVKRMLSEALSRGFVEEVSVLRKRKVPIARPENWYRDKETGVIYSLIPPDPPAEGLWAMVDIDDMLQHDTAAQ